MGEAMRGLICGLMMLILGITAEQAQAGSGSGTRRTLRGSDAARLRNLLPQRAVSRSKKSTRRRSVSATAKNRTQKRPSSSDKRTHKKQIDARVQAIIQQRIADALQAEMLQNGGKLPDEKRQQEIARQQLKQAQAEGLISGDADFGSANPTLGGNTGGLPGGSLFNGGNGSTRKSGGTSRSQIYRPSRSRMYLPSRSRINVPRKSNLQRTRRSTTRARSASPAGNGALPLPDLTGGNGATGSPEQLQRQLQRLLK